MPLRTRGGVPRFEWGPEAMREVGEAVRAQVDERTFGRGVALDGPLPAGVDLVNTGSLRRGFSVVSATRNRARLGIRGRARGYAADVNKQWPWMGITPNDRKALGAAVRQIYRTYRKGPTS